MIPIREMREKRFQFLRLLYEETSGDQTKMVDWAKLGEKLGFDQRLTNRIIRYLSSERLIKLYGGGGCRLTHQGIKAVERAESQAEVLAQDLPPVKEDLGMFEVRLRQFFQEVGSLHAIKILEMLPYNIPLMKQYPHIAASEILRFREYLVVSPSHNLSATFSILHTIAAEVPELRDQIIKDLGDVLCEYKLIMRELPDRRVLESLLTTLELPVSARDDHIKSLARSLVSLDQPVILVVGAGFSYDTMPITGELKPLLVSVLRDAGVENPAKLLQENDQEAWQIIKGREDQFKRMFAGWCAKSQPSVQHNTACEMLHAGQITHLISFNWDDLCERAYVHRFGALIPKITRDEVLPDQPALWKLHGDVENLEEEWVFPYERGRVFDSLMQSLEQAVRVKPPAHALIVGYSEWEPEVKERLVAWLEKNVSQVLRVRPTWPEHDEGGMADSAKGFFQRLGIYMELEGRGKS